MRGPASFANCSPCPAPVTIINHNIVVPEGHVQMFQELFSYDPGLSRGKIETLDEISGSLVPGVRAKYRLSLENAPIGPHSVEVFLAGGTSRQRPLIGQHGRASSVLEGYPNGNVDFYVDGRFVYLCIDLTSDEVINVQYLGVPVTADRPAGPPNVGAQLFVAVPVIHFDYCYGRDGTVPKQTDRGLYHYSYGLLPGMDNRGVSFAQFEGTVYRLVVPKLLHGVTQDVTQITIDYTTETDSASYTCFVGQVALDPARGMTAIMVDVQYAGLINAINSGNYHLEFKIGSDSPTPTAYFSTNNFHKYGQSYQGELGPGISEDWRFGPEDFYRQLRRARFNYQPAVSGWLKADGQTVYAIGLYPALYRHLQTQNLIAEAADNHGDGVEMYSRATHFIIRELTPADPSANLVLLKA